MQNNKQSKMFRIKNSGVRSQKYVHNLHCRAYFNCSVIVKDSLENVLNVVLEWGKVKEISLSNGNLTHFE